MAELIHANVTIKINDKNQVFNTILYISQWTQLKDR